MTRTVVWNCEGCPAECYGDKPADGWQQTTISAKFKRYGQKGAGRLANTYTSDLCPQCAEYVEQKLDPRLWRAAEESNVSKIAAE